jgi:hypothetical protein
VFVTVPRPVTGSGLNGFSGIQGLGIQGASVQGLQALGSATSAPAGLASVSVTSPQATASITPANVTGPAPVTATANAPASIAVTVNAGLATVTVTAQSAIQTEAAAAQAQVTVAAEQPSVSSGFSVLVAQVTAAAEQPNTQITVPAGFAQVQANANPPAGFSTQPSTAQTVTVAAEQPSAQITVTAGLASVTATAAIPTFPIPAALASVTVSANNLSAFSLTAAAGLADPAATVPQPALSLTANAGLATVTVTGNSIPYAGSAHPGEATVLVSAFNASGTYALAGNAPVIVSANQPTNGITAKAGLATTTVTAAGITVPVSPGTAQVTASVPQLKPSVTTAAELAMGFALALEAGSLAPLATGTINGLCVFEPPLVKDRPPYLPDSSPRQYALWRHFDNRVRGVNVWKRSDGTYCVDTIANYESAQTHPAAYFSDDPIGPDLTTTEKGLSDSNVNYPWNPFPGSTNSEIPGSYAYNVNWDQTTQDFIQNPYLVRMWQGGALNIILQSDAIDLTQGGFGDCIDVAPPGSVYTAHQYKGGMNQ